MNPIPPPRMGSPDTQEDVGLSHASLSFSGGGGLTLWSAPASSSRGRTAAETMVELHPDRPVVVGRQEGGEVPYLDPYYLPTRVVPETGQTVLRQGGGERDNWVSRGHFLLRAVAAGVTLLNGVPRRGGGVRPPLNGTRLLEPEARPMAEGEEYLIRRGAAARIELPNGTQVLIHAE
jgi:hypothetical protein